MGLLQDRYMRLLEDRVMHFLGILSEDTMFANVIVVLVGPPFFSSRSSSYYIQSV